MGLKGANILGQIAEEKIMRLILFGLIFTNDNWIQLYPNSHVMHLSKMHSDRMSLLNYDKSSKLVEKPLG